MSRWQWFEKDLFNTSSFTTPSFATNIVTGSQNIQVGGTHHQLKLMPDGSYVNEEIEVTDKNVPEIRTEQRQETLGNSRAGLTNLFIYFIGLSLLSIPILWFVFQRPRKRAILHCLAYGLTLFLVLSACYIPFVGFDYYIQDFAIYIIQVIGIGILLLAWPLAISRSKGFELSTNRLARQRNLEFKN